MPQSGSATHRDKNHKDRVADIHRRAFTIDCHFDLAYDVANRRERGEKRIIADSYLESFKKGGFDLIVSALFVHDLFLPETGLRRTLDQIGFLHEEMDETPGLFRLCRTMEEAYEAKRQGETALFLSLEGADPIQNDLRLLRIMHELGVRGVGLVWSRRNYAADGAFFEQQTEGKKGGLTPFGVQLVKEAERLGMFLDVSHLNDEGFWDVMEIAEQPLIASHSNCRALAGTMRNLTDEQIKAIGKNRGVIGMNSVSLFTRTDIENPSISHLVDHIDHICNLIGSDHVGIGFDICNSFSNFLNWKDDLPAFDIIRDHSELDGFTEELVKRGYTDEQILGILGGNLERVFREVLGE